MHNSFVGPLFFYLNNRGACSYKMIIALIYCSFCISIGTAAKVSDSYRKLLKTSHPNEDVCKKSSYEIVSYHVVINHMNFYSNGFCILHIVY